jgi:hypothetical protein
MGAFISTVACNFLLLKDVAVSLTATSFLAFAGFQPAVATTSAAGTKLQQAIHLLNMPG